MRGFGGGGWGSKRMQILSDETQSNQITVSVQNNFHDNNGFRCEEVKVYGDEDFKKKVPRRVQQNLQTDGQSRTSEHFNVTAADATSLCVIIISLQSNVHSFYRRTTQLCLAFSSVRPAPYHNNTVQRNPQKKILYNYCRGLTRLGVRLFFASKDERTA